VFYRSGSKLINLSNVAYVEPFDSEIVSSSGVVVWFSSGVSVQLDGSVDDVWSVVSPSPVELPIPMMDGESPEDYLTRITAG
jgi:hypothetical protein